MPDSFQDLIPSLILWAGEDGKGANALKVIATGQWDSLKKQGGRQLISSTLNGKSFNFAFDKNVSASTLAKAATEAYKQFLAMDAAGTLAAYQTRPLVTRTRAVFAPAAS